LIVGSEKQSAIRKQKKQTYLHNNSKESLSAYNFISVQTTVTYVYWEQGTRHSRWCYWGIIYPHTMLRGECIPIMAVKKPSVSLKCKTGHIQYALQPDLRRWVFIQSKP